MRLRVIAVALALLVGGTIVPVVSAQPAQAAGGGVYLMVRCPGNYFNSGVWYRTQYGESGFARSNGVANIGGAVWVGVHSVFTTACLAT